MPDYSLGRAHGRIDIDYDGKGADEASTDLHRVAVASEEADKSLAKTNRTLENTERAYDSAGTSASGYERRQRDVVSAVRDVEVAEKNRRSTLLDAKSTLDDIKASEEALTEAKNKHAAANAALAAAEAARIEGLSTMASLIPRLNLSLDGWTTRLANSAAESGNAADKANKLSQSLSLVAKGAMMLGQPEVAAGFEGAAVGVDTLTVAVNAAVGGFKAMAGFEMEFAKISGLILGVTSLGGLAGLAGGSSVMGIVELADAVRELSGGLGLLPAVISGVVFSAGTLKLAFHGVGDALTDMMADDPKKFLDDIKNMAPLAAQAMIGIAQFRDQFKLAGGEVQESFFAQIVADITPLIQTWLPAVTSGMSQLAGIFGQAAHEFIGLLQQPVMMQGFQDFVANVGRGLGALIPAIAPLVQMFRLVTVVGAKFFEQIGTRLAQGITELAAVIEHMVASGQLRNWIQAGINGLANLGKIVFNLGSAFGTIMDVADRFGGGGLLGWLQQLTQAFANWTQSADGQKSLIGFFTLMRQATDAFLPMLPPLLNGLGSIGAAFVQLGVASAPGWQTVFNTFAQVMAQLGPQIAATAPAINTFLTGLAKAFAQLMGTIGPQLPRIFGDLANAFVALLPQIAPLTETFLELATRVGPQLPKLFASFTALIQALMPYMPTIIGLIREFVTAITALIQVITFNINALTSFLDWLGKVADGFGDVILRIPDAVWTAMGQAFGYVGEIWDKLVDDAKDWGKNLLKNFAQGLADSVGVSGVTNAAKHIADIVADFWLTKSPAARGPLHDASPNQMGGNVVRNFAAGMAAAHPAAAAAAGATAGAVVGALSSAGGAPAAGGRSTADGALLPDNIASADTSILTAYLRHQFSDRRGLKGLAKDLGDALQVIQNGFNLGTQQVISPMLQALGMIPGLNERGWRKLTPAEITAQQQSELQRKAIEAQKKGPTWNDVMGGDSATPGGPNIPLGLSPTSSKDDIQKAIIAAGRARGLNDSAIQTALAVAAAESGFNPTISGGVQGSAGLVSGLFQQSPSSGWGTLEQVNDPNYAINAFYDAFAKQLGKNPGDPLLAAVLTQNPQLAGNAKGSDYWNAVTQQLGLANSIMTAYGPTTKGPSWAQLAGSSLSTASGTVTSGRSPTGRSIYTGPHTEDTQGAVVPNVANAEEIIKQLFPGVTVNNDYRPKDGYNEHSSGEAIDFSINPGGEMGVRTAAGQALGNQLKDYLLRNAKYFGLQYGLWDQTQYNADGTSSPMEDRGSVTENHGDHFHARFLPGPLLTPGSTPPARPAAGTAAGAGLVLPSGQSLDQLTDNTARNASVNEQLLQAYLQGNPELAQQISAAQVPGASDQTVSDTLNNISSTITTLQKQDSVGNKNTIDALQSTQSKIAQQQGFTQNQQGPIDAASSILGSAGNAVTSVFQAIQSGLESLTATQDITDRLVYGIRNTEDISHIVDDVQKYITFAADIASSAGQILSTIGSIVSIAEAAGGPMGGNPGAAAGEGLQAAGSIASLISGVLQGVNAAIDFGQQVYEITMSYAGRFMSYLTGLGGTELMGNVGFLLNKNTGQLLSYSMDNPEQKNVAQVPSWMRYFYDYNGRGNSNPGPSQLNIFAGPGQSPAQMMNETMWLVHTGGTTGALSAANF